MANALSASNNRGGEFAVSISPQNLAHIIDTGYMLAPRTTFLTLPRELRDKIYDFAVGRAGIVDLIHLTRANTNQITLNTHPPSLALSLLDTTQSFGWDPLEAQEMFYEGTTFRAEPRFLQQLLSGCVVGFRNSPLCVQSTEFKLRIKTLVILEPFDTERGPNLNNYLPDISSELITAVAADCRFLRQVTIQLEPWGANKGPFCSTLEILSYRYRLADTRLHGGLCWLFKPHEPCRCHSWRFICPACISLYLRHGEMLPLAEELWNQSTFVGSFDERYEIT